jgi:hypothetical protein
VPERSRRHRFNEALRCLSEVEGTGLLPLQNPLSKHLISRGYYHIVNTSRQV